MKLRYTTIRNWLIRIRRYGLMNTVRLKLFLKKDSAFRIRHLGTDIWLRGNSVDFYVFDSIFGKGEYDFDPGFRPEYIIDAGAFTGLSAIWFQMRYPGVRIIAVEPEESNFDMLVRNTRSFESIIAVRGALYGEDLELTISNPSAEKYAFRVGETVSGGVSVSGFTVSDLMNKYMLPRIDLLKMDIEGSEYSVFMNDPGSWIRYTNGLIIELHEYVQPGVSDLVTGTLKESGFSVTGKGENLIALRSGPFCAVVPGVTQ